MPPSDILLQRCADAVRLPLEGAPPRRAEDAAIYLAHVEGSASLRRLAEASGRPPSSVARAIRRVEALRDDPLIDRALGAIGQAARRSLGGEGAEAAPDAAGPADRPDRSAYQLRVAAAALERLCEPEAFLMVAEGVEKAGVFSRRNDFRRPIALLTVEAAADLAARDWVRCVSRRAASAKYAISEPGRAWLRRRRAELGSDAGSPHAAQHRVEGTRAVAAQDGGIETIRVNLAESPLAWLSARRGADGVAYLAAAEVEAGERLRCDFEAAQMGPRVTQDWRGFLTPRDGSRAPGGPGEGPEAARERTARALEALGPGLADVALRVCCFLEGLELVERRLGWSARSGKVVLKIALQRLALHYGLSRPG